MFGSFEYEIQNQIDFDYYQKGSVLSLLLNGNVFKKYTCIQSHIIAMSLLKRGYEYNLIIDSKINNN